MILMSRSSLLSSGLNPGLCSFQHFINGVRPCHISDFQMTKQQRLVKTLHDRINSSENHIHEIPTNWIKIKFWNKCTQSSTTMNIIAQKKLSGNFRWLRTGYELVVGHDHLEGQCSTFLFLYFIFWHVSVMENRDKWVNITSCLKRKLSKV